MISAEGNWRVLSTGDFGEEVYATPAIADGSLYIRTIGHLYCFAREEKAACCEDQGPRIALYST